MNLLLHPVSLISILIALSVHECAHAFVAYRLGDPTAKYSGRLTLNPLAHLEPLGTLMFLFVGFGWGKPVPVDPRYFHHPKRDTALVALAGPVSNFLLAIFFFIGLLILAPAGLQSGVWGLLDFSAQGPLWTTFLQQFCTSSLFLNLGLMAFNLLPVAPLDGSKIIGAFVPYQYEHEYEQYLQWGPYILLALLLGERAIGISFLSDWIGWIMNTVLGLFLSIAGIFLAK